MSRQSGDVYARRTCGRAPAEKRPGGQEREQPQPKLSRIRKRWSTIIDPNGTLSGVLLAKRRSWTNGSVLRRSQDTCHEFLRLSYLVAINRAS